MQITTVMVVALLIWCPLTHVAARTSVNFRRRRLPRNLRFSHEALGWLEGTFVAAHSRGRDVDRLRPLAAVDERIRDAGAGLSRDRLSEDEESARSRPTSSAWYALVCTGVITLLAVHDHSRRRPAHVLRQPDWAASRCSLVGPRLLRLAFHIFVVIVGVLILSGAVNTSIIGANGVLNRVAEDGVLLDWFRKPHRRFGTTYRIINMITLLQVATILASRGDMISARRSLRVRRGVELLPQVAGRAGAALSAHDQEYKMPAQFPTSAGWKSRSGLGLTTLILCCWWRSRTCSPRQIATIYGVSFTCLCS